MHFGTHRQLSKVLQVLADSEVELYEASLLLSVYALYVLVMAFFKPIVKLCCPRTGLEDGDDEDGVGVGQDYYSYSPQLDGADQSRYMCSTSCCR
jgi:hypothetical protein